MLWYLHVYSTYFQATSKARFCGSCGRESTREWHGAYSRLVCTNMCINQFVNTPFEDWCFAYFSELTIQPNKQPIPWSKDLLKMFTTAS